MVDDPLIQFGSEMISEDLDHSPGRPMSWTFDTDGSDMRSRSEGARDSGRSACCIRFSARAWASSTARI